MSISFNATGVPWQFASMDKDYEAYNACYYQGRRAKWRLADGGIDHGLSALELFNNSLHGKIVSKKMWKAVRDWGDNVARSGVEDSE
jgi:hypothetical protein